MKKLLLIMLIAIVAISCKKEEKSNVAPLPTIVDQQYVRINANSFPKDQQVVLICEVRDDGAHNPTFGYTVERLTIITSNSTDSTLNIKLPKRFYIENDSIKKGPDSTFRIHLNRFVVEGTDTVFQMGKYKIFSPYETTINSFTKKSLLFEYKSDELKYYRKIKGTMYNEQYKK